MRGDHCQGRGKALVKVADQGFPQLGGGLAVIAAVGLFAVGVPVWAVVAVFASWVFLLWPAPAKSVAPEVPNQRLLSTTDVIAEVIELLGPPLVLLERDRIVAANAAARTTLGTHIVGQDARMVFRHPEAVRLLTSQSGVSVTTPGLTGARSLWQLTRQNIDEKHWVIELSDRTTEADISRAHTDFVANASHELRTPLAAVIGYVETLAEDPGKFDAATAARFHNTVLREAKRMQALVSDLMSLSQLEAEKHDLPTDRIDLGSLVARVVGEFTATIGNARLKLTCGQEKLPISGDSKQLEQLLRNLIDNALKYGDADKPVEVVLSELPGMAGVTVTDHGAGIAADHLPHLTRRFYRTDPGRSRAAGGTGLGLAIVKHIVERHRGKLDISSTLGTGTRVAVQLPLLRR